MSGNSIFYKYFCTTERNIIIEERDVSESSPTVCKNEGSAITGLVNNAISTSTHKRINNSKGGGSPTITDDITKGYSIGSEWFDEVSVKLFTCKDATIGAAIWKESTIDTTGTQSFENISITGTIDGRDVSVDGSNLDYLYETTASNLGLQQLLQAESNQLKNIGSTTLSSAQWGYLGASDQPFATTDSVTFADITIDNITVDGNSLNADSGNLVLSSTSGNVTSSDPVAISNYIELADITAPINGADGFGRIYKKTGDSGLFWKPDSTGVEKNIQLSNFEAIVAADGTGDYTKPSAAFAAGKKRVYVRAGTYVETTNIVIPDKGALVGESSGGVAIIFIGSFCINVDGNSGVQETTGTISCTSGSSSVVGIGTTFTNLSPGDYIQLKSNHFEIASIADDTNLTISTVNNSGDISGQALLAQSLYSSIIISNLRIANSSISGIYIRGADRIIISNIGITLCNIAIEIVSSYNINIISAVCITNVTDGISLTNTFGCAIGPCSSTNNGDNGIVIAGNSETVVVTNCYIGQNTVNGIEVTGTSNQIQLNLCDIEYNNYGILSNSGTQKIQILGCTIKNNTLSGAFLSNSKTLLSSCDINNNNDAGVKLNNNATIIGNIFSENTGAGIHILSTTEYCVISGNKSDNNTDDGILIEGNNSIVSGNVCTNNGNYGIHIVAGTLDCKISGNILDGNTGGHYLNEGGNTELDGTHSYYKTVDPTSSDDISLGYANGSVWINTNNNKYFVCVDATDGAAVWLDSSVSDHNGLTGLTTGDPHTQYTLLAGRSGGQSIIGGTLSGNDLTLESTSNATKGNIILSDPTLVNSIDTNTTTTLLIGSSTATKVELADSSIITEIQGPLNALEGLDVTGNITLTGTVDGIDIAALASDVNGFPDSLKNLDTSEINQIANIGAVTISGTQWGYLGNSNQGVNTSDNVTFGQITGTLQTSAQTNITSLGTLSLLNVDNLRIDGNTLSSTDTNGNISILPNGSGNVVLKGDPTTALGAATKQYVDSSATGLQVKNPVRVKTAGSLDSYTQSGTGIGATLTATANGSINNSGIDGLTDITSSDRILVDSTGSATGEDNGIYIVTTVGDGSNPWVLTRATDLDTDIELVSGVYTFVQEGTNHGGSAYTVTTANPITIDVTATTWTLFSSSSGGDITDASNIGTSGVGLYKDKQSGILRFKKINSGSTKISITDDTGNDEVDIDINQNNLTELTGITGNISTVHSIIFNTSPSETPAEGTLYYDGTHKSLAYYNNETGFEIALGRANYVRVINNTGSTLTRGSAVYVNGVSSGLPQVALAQADEKNKASVIGLVAVDITNTSIGYVINFGVFENIDTSSFTEGDSLFLSEANLGELRVDEPLEGNHNTKIGTVLEISATVGSIFVNILEESDIINSTLIQNTIATILSDGLAITENTPTLDTSIKYSTGTYYINNFIKSISSGTLDLETPSDAWSTLSNSERAIIRIYVTNSETINFVVGTPVADTAIVTSPNSLPDTISIALVTIYKDSGGTKKPISNIDILDLRWNISNGLEIRDENIRVSGRDTTSGYLADKIVAGGDVTITTQNIGGNEVLEISSSSVGTIDHGVLSGLGDDDHTQYALLSGRSGGQTIKGSTVALGNLILESTSDASKGSIISLNSFKTNIIDARTATTLIIGDSTATKVEIGKTGTITEIIGGLDIQQNLDVTGNILVSGMVDGRDIATDGSTIDTLTGIGLTSLVAAEVSQLQNIDTTPISSTQWGYLGSLNQSLATTDTVSFATINGTIGTAAQTNITSLGTLTGLSVGGNITVTGTVDGRDVATDGGVLDNLDTGIGLSGLTVGEVTQIKNIDSSTISSTQWSYLGSLDQSLGTGDSVTFNQIAGTLTTSAQGNITSVGTLTGLNINGNITLNGTVDGRDVGADGLVLNNLNTTIGLGDLIAAEVTQLKNIDTTTISTTQWGYLGTLNQALTTSDSVTFNQITGTSYVGLPTSSNTTSGIIELATQAEVNAATDTTRAIVPAFIPKNNFAATSAPLVTDDANIAYSVGSTWIDTTTNFSYKCVDSTIGSAIWVQMTGFGFSQYFDAYTTTESTLTTTGVYVDMLLDVQREIDATIYTHTVGTSDVTVTLADKYLVLARVTTDHTSGTSRTDSAMRLMIDTGSGFTAIPGSFGFMYNRDVNQGTNTTNVGLVLDLSVGDKIKVQAKRNSGGGPLKLLSGACSLTISTVRGQKGDQGLTGSGSSITLENDNVTVTNTPHDTINFSDDFTVADNGDGSATISAVPNVFGTQFQQVSSLGISSTISDIFQTKLTLTTPSLPSGTYRIGWMMQYNNLSISNYSDVRCQLNNVTTLSESLIEHKDPSNYPDFVGFAYQSLSGVNTIDLDYRASGSTTNVRNARIELWRVE